VGAVVVSWPFFVLPEKERATAITATNDLFAAVGNLHLSVLRVAVRGVGAVTREAVRVAEAAAPAVQRSTAKVPIETNAR
jgi:hypothetical protein